MAKMKDYYESVYSQDQSDEQPHGWIQWKGTDVCMDVHCECGHHGHFDGDFFYNYVCPECGTHYAVGQVVKLIKLTPEQITHVNDHHCAFRTTEIDDE